MLTIMRHAESRFNTGISDEYDSKLSEEGQKQASLCTGNYDVVIVSNLSRAQETLKYSNIKYNTLIVSDLFREIKYEHVSDYVKGEKIIPETITELKNRLFEAIKMLYNLCITNNRNVLVISHNGFIRILLSKKYDMNNCEKTMLSRDEITYLYRK